MNLTKSFSFDKLNRVMQKIIFFRPSQLARTKNGNELLRFFQNSRVEYKGSQVHPLCGI